MAERPLSICLLGYRSHPYCGGQGVYLHYLSKALVEAGHRVDVISGQPYPELDPRVRLIKLPGLNLFAHKNPMAALRWRHLLHWSDFVEWLSKLTGGFAEPYAFGRRVVKYLRTEGGRYDIVHDNQSLCYALLDIQKSCLPVVATIHHPITRDRQLAIDAAPSWGYRLLVRRWYQFLTMQKRVVKKLPHIVTVSMQSYRDSIEQFALKPEQLELVYNGIDTEVFRPLPQQKRNPLRIMTTASADQPLKGLRFLLRAMASLRGRFPQLELLVIGKLTSDGATEKLLHELQLKDAVQFVSGISNGKLVEHYASAGVVVCPSLYEGFGLPAGEAMACGVPVISSDGGALPEVVGDAGVIVPAGDSRALAQALETVLEDDVLRETLGQKGRARILKQFSWARAAGHLVGYYRRIIDASVGQEKESTTKNTSADSAYTISQLEQTAAGSKVASDAEAA